MIICLVKIIQVSNRELYEIKHTGNFIAFSHIAKKKGALQVFKEFAFKHEWAFAAPWQFFDASALKT